MLYGSLNSKLVYSKEFCSVLIFRIERNPPVHVCGFPNKWNPLRNRTMHQCQHNSSHTDIFHISVAISQCTIQRKPNPPPHFFCHQKQDKKMHALNKMAGIEFCGDDCMGLESCTVQQGVGAAVWNWINMLGVSLSGTIPLRLPSQLLR